MKALYTGHITCVQILLYDKFTKIGQSLYTVAIFIEIAKLPLIRLVLIYHPVNSARYSKFPPTWCLTILLDF